MTHDSPEYPDPLLQALDRLKSAIAAEAAPDRSHWANTVREGLEQVEQVFREQAEHNHKELFSRIRMEDPGLIRRVELLRETDGALLQQLAQHRQQVDDLVARLPTAEPECAEAAVQELISSGGTLVQTILGHHEAITHWFLEAFHRDRGIVD